MSQKKFFLKVPTFDWVIIRCELCGAEGLVREELEDAVRGTGIRLGMGIKEAELWEE